MSVLPWHSFDDKDFQIVSGIPAAFPAPAGVAGQAGVRRFRRRDDGRHCTMNGHAFDEYRGGYTPFSFELTPHLKLGADNVLEVEVDSTERKDIPPFGDNIDYLTFGGIYRDVALRVVPQSISRHCFAQSDPAVMEGGRASWRRCYLDGPWQPEHHHGRTTRRRRVLTNGSVRRFRVRAVHYDVRSSVVGDIELWDLSNPKLYSVSADWTTETARATNTYARRLPRGASSPRPSFLPERPACETARAEPASDVSLLGGRDARRVQASDAMVLRKELHCNIVRTSHYPQSPHFLDACDDRACWCWKRFPAGSTSATGLAGSLGGQRGAMIRRDWNHPSIVLWGVRINESADNHEFYTRTNGLARELDDHGSAEESATGTTRNCWRTFSR